MEMDVLIRWKIVTPEQREALANDPKEYFRIRKALESDGNLIHESTLPGTEMQKAFGECTLNWGP
jgi:hypothetical protein